MGLDPDLNSSQDELSHIEGIEEADPDAEAIALFDNHTRDSDIDGEYDDTLPAAVNISGLKFERESRQEEWRDIAA